MCMDNEIEISREGNIKQTIGYDFIECHICGKRFSSIKNHLIWAHNININEFSSKNINYVFTSIKFSEKARERRKNQYNYLYSEEAEKRRSESKREYYRRETPEQKEYRRNKNSGVNSVHYGKKKPREQVEKQKKTYQESLRNENSSLYRHLYGKEFKEKRSEHGKKIWVNRKSNEKKYEDYLQKLSENTSKSIAEGRAFTYGCKNHKKGFYHSVKSNKDIYFVSSWEEKFMSMCDEIKEIKEFDKIGFSIKYQDINNQTRRYIPDFMINNKIIVEVKPKTYVGKYPNPYKFNSCLSYCLKNNLKFIIIAEDELNKESIIKLISD